MNGLKSFLFLIFLSFANLVFADPSDKIANQILLNTKNTDLQQRITQISAALLNKPYQEEPIGEGAAGQFNQEPLYRFDKFDCETYVNTVLALSLSNTTQDFKSNLIKLIYTNGNISFQNRSHFPSADWVPNNLRNGFIQEITAKVAGADNTAIASAYINRKDWYQHLTINRIHLQGITPQQKAEKLQQLQALSASAANETANLVYIPLRKLVSASSANWNLINRIPNGTIVLIVHHSQAVTEKIGTQMNVSHMGFIIWKNNQPYLRAASSLKGITTDQLLVPYLQHYLQDPNVKGISLFSARMDQEA